MASATRFSYQRLRHEGGLDEEVEEMKSYRRIRNFAKLKRRFSMNRRGLKLRIPGLARFLRKRTRFLSRVRVSWRNALKRLKNGRPHMNDLFGGNFMVMQLSPTPFKCGDRPYMASHGFPASRRVTY